MPHKRRSKTMCFESPSSSLLRKVRAQVIAQIIPFNPLKTNNTDGILDLLCYAPRVRQEFGEFITSGLILEMQEFSSQEVLSEEVTSPF